MKIKALMIIVLLIAFLLTKKNTIISRENDEIFKNKMVSVFYENKKINVDLDEYIFNVLACEMPASFQEEALKAGAVAIRTFYLYKESNNKDYVAKNIDQCYISNDKLVEKWGKDYNFYIKKLKRIIKETQNEYLTYNNEVIPSFYFSLSNGYTENVKEVFSLDLPYLKMVDSSWDKNVKNYENIITLNKSDFINKLNIVDNADIYIQILKLTDSHRIKEIKINNHIYSGIEIRKKLNLKSADFDIIVNGDLITVTTRGNGHGVGMSQYGANEMAKKGYKYKEILNHYYNGTKISKYSV